MMGLKKLIVSVIAWCFYGYISLGSKIKDTSARNPLKHWLAGTCDAKDGTKFVSLVEGQLHISEAVQDLLQERGFKQIPNFASLIEFKQKWSDASLEEAHSSLQFVFPDSITLKAKSADDSLIIYAEGSYSSAKNRYFLTVWAWPSASPKSSGLVEPLFALRRCVFKKMPLSPVHSNASVSSPSALENIEDFLSVEDLEHKEATRGVMESDPHGHILIKYLPYELLISAEGPMNGIMKIRSVTLNSSSISLENDIPE